MEGIPHYRVFPKDEHYFNELLPVFKSGIHCDHYCSFEPEVISYNRFFFKVTLKYLTKQELHDLEPLLSDIYCEFKRDMRDFTFLIPFKDVAHARNPDGEIIHTQTLADEWIAKNAPKFSEVEEYTLKHEEVSLIMDLVRYYLTFSPYNSEEKQTKILILVRNLISWIAGGKNDVKRALIHSLPLNFQEITRHLLTEKP
ncbi:MAG: hypothetical protein QNJ37_18615 [Crocosphaera sp.]|nr:hypothetical protein [Crocosphaera sp.]